MKEIIEKVNKYEKFVINLIGESQLNSFYEISDLKEYNTEILNYVAQNFTEEELKFLNNKDANSPTFDEATKLKNSIISTYYSKNKKFLNIIKYYLFDDAGGYGDYFTYKNGKVLTRNIIFDPKSNGDYESTNKKYLEARRKYSSKLSFVPLIIAEDGQCYLAKHLHKYLSDWLTLNNVNLKNALELRIFFQDKGRFTIQPVQIDDNLIDKEKDNGEMGFSIEQTLNQKYGIALSYEQVQSLINVYDCCINCNKHFIGLEDNLANENAVTGLGFDKFSFNAEVLSAGKMVNITKNNERQFSYFRGYFSSEDFLRKLKDYNITGENCK